MFSPCLWDKSSFSTLPLMNSFRPDNLSCCKFHFLDPNYAQESVSDTFFFSATALSLQPASGFLRRHIADGLWACHCPSSKMNTLFVKFQHGELDSQEQQIEVFSLFERGNSPFRSCHNLFAFFPFPGP